MSGLGLLQTRSLKFIPFEASRMYTWPSTKVGNGGFMMPRKCMERTAELHIAGLEGGQGQRVCPKLIIPEIPYVDEVVKKLSQKTQPDLLYLEEAYESCRIFCANQYTDKFVTSVFGHSKIEHQRGIWAIYAYCRRIDDLVDSTHDYSRRSEYLDHWEARTQDILNGLPHDMLDAALVDTISKFHIDIKLFQDMIKGMRMDITKTRYANFEELFLYCYCVSGSITLMVLQVLGIAPESTVSSKIIYEGLIYTAIGGQLTNILKDVSDDAQLGRVYFPQDELAEFGLCDEDIFSKKVTGEWRDFIKNQIHRARLYYKLGEQGVSQIDKSNRSKILAGLMMYRNILDEIEENEYDNLNNKVEEMAL